MISDGSPSTILEDGEYDSDNTVPSPSPLLSPPMFIAVSTPSGTANVVQQPQINSQQLSNSQLPDLAALTTLTTTTSGFYTLTAEKNFLLIIFINSKLCFQFIFLVNISIGTIWISVLFNTKWDIIGQHTNTWNLLAALYKHNLLSFNVCRFNDAANGQRAVNNSGGIDVCQRWCDIFQINFYPRW